MNAANIRIKLNRGFEALGKTLQDGETKNLGRKALRGIARISEPVKNAVNPTMFATALYTCALVPRILNARDKTEKREIITRDAIAISTLVFAMKAINGAIGKVAQKKTGIVLTSETKPLKNLNPLQKFVEFIRPTKGVSLLSDEYLKSKLVVSDLDGLKGLLKWLEDNGGDVTKALTTDAKTNGPLATFTNQLFKDGVKGKKAVDIIKALDEKPKIAEQIIRRLSQDTNPLVQKAKFINSGIIKTLGLTVVVAVLGVGLPMLNKFLTKKLDEKAWEEGTAREEWQKENIFIKQLHLDKLQTQTFQNFLGNTKMN